VPVDATRILYEMIYNNLLEANFGGIDYSSTAQCFPDGRCQDNVAYDNTIIVGTQTYVPRTASAISPSAPQHSWRRM